VAALVLGVLHLALRRLELNPSDEGFLWYGFQRTLAGEVPLRDFQSYEPGRYYWCAVLGLLRGDGILALRDGIALFQLVGLVFGLLVLDRVVPRRWLLVPAAAVLVLWSFPRHKAFEAAITTIGVWTAVRVLEDERGRRWPFVAGVATGLAGFFGRNHGLYLSLGLGATVAWAAWTRPERAWGRGLGRFALGIAAGCLPLLGMVAFVPGFAGALLDSVVFFSKHGSNHPFPYPWPWRFGYADLRTYERAGMGLAFYLPIVVYAAGLALAWRGRRGARIAPVVVAAALVGIPYVHHHAVRSDPEHLAQSFTPALLGAVALAGLARRRLPASVATVGGLVAMTLVVVPTEDPLTASWRLAGPEVERVPLDAAGDTLYVKKSEASSFDFVRQLVARVVPPEEPLFIAPVHPTLYPLLGRVSPTWRTYFLWTLDEQEQRAIQRSLDERGVRYALIVDLAGFRFRDACPLVWEDFTAGWARLESAGLPREIVLLRRP